MRQSQLRKDLFKTQVRLLKWRTSLTVERLRLTPPLPELAPVVFLWVNTDLEDKIKVCTVLPHFPCGQTNFNAKNDEEEEYLHKFFFHRCMFTSGKHCSFDRALTVGLHEAAILIVNKLYFLHCFTCLQH